MCNAEIVETRGRTEQIGVARTRRAESAEKLELVKKRRDKRVERKRQAARKERTELRKLITTSKKAVILAKQREVADVKSVLAKVAVKAVAKRHYALVRKKRQIARVKELSRLSNQTQLLSTTRVVEDLRSQQQAAADEEEAKKRAVEVEIAKLRAREEAVADKVKQWATKEANLNAELRLHVDEKARERRALLKSGRGQRQY
jgi:hypothetical protein